MAYQIGQIRKKQSQNYMLGLNNPIRTHYISVSPFSVDDNDNPYYDFAIQQDHPQNTSVPIFDSSKVYFLRFKVLRIPQFFYSADNIRGEYNPSYDNADILNLTVELRHKGAGENSPSRTANVQTIGTCTIPKADLFNTKIRSDDLQDQNQYDYIASKYFEQKGKSPYVSFSFVFSPSNEINSQSTYYDTLVFRTQRISYDALELPEIKQNVPFDPEDESEQTEPKDRKERQKTLTNGRSWIINSKYYKDYFEEQTFERVGNNGQIHKYKIDLPTIVIEDQLPQRFGYENIPSNKGELAELININQNNTKWIKIGYQCRPGSLIVINKQPIRVGKSGIFELDNGLPITDFRIANPGGSQLKYIDAFLLDYAYVK